MIGYAFWEPHPVSIEGCDTVVITNAAVEKSYRDHRVASMLVYLRLEYLDVEKKLLIQSHFDNRLKEWALSAGFKIVPFEFFGLPFKHYYCDCDDGQYKEDCVFRDRECQLLAHFPGDPYYPAFRIEAARILKT